MRRLVTDGYGKMAFAVLCDGMGGLQHGEIASTQVVSAFVDWMYQRLPTLLNQQLLLDHIVRGEWCALVESQHLLLRELGQESNWKIGTTATVLLLTESRYFLLNIGDSRAYCMKATGIRQLTEDHTVVNREIALGNLTPEQAENAPIRNLLTRCIGVGDYQQPDLFFGVPERETIYLLCSDGFRHCISSKEIHSAIFNAQCTGATELRRRSERLVELNKQRGENDNISVITVFCA